MAGRYFDELNIGEESMSQGRTITEADLVMFCSLCGLQNPLFTDEEFAQKTAFGTRVVPGPLTVSYAIGLGDYLYSGTSTAVLSWDNIKFTSPVKPGDTISLKTTVTGRRESSSQPDRGIVNLRQEVLNQHNEVVCTFDRSLMLLKRPQG
jgi:itaconyl-CoA hydratase